MPIVEDDLIHRLSGGVNNTDPNNSIGGAMSTDPGGVIVSDEDNNDMDDITSTEAEDSIVIYHGYYYENIITSNPALVWTNPVFWIDSQTSSIDTSVDIAIAAEAKNTSIESLADEETSPGGGVSFTNPVNKAAGISIGDLAQDDYRGHWVKYTVDAAAGSSIDAYTIKAEGDTLP